LRECRGLRGTLKEHDVLPRLMYVIKGWVFCWTRGQRKRHAKKKKVGEHWGGQEKRI